jgi:hypothetical protein
LVRRPVVVWALNQALEGVANGGIRIGSAKRRRRDGVVEIGQIAVLDQLGLVLLRSKVRMRRPAGRKERNDKGKSAKTHHDAQVSKLEIVNK